MDIEKEKKLIEIMCCFAHEDQRLFEQLKKQLQVLENHQLITIWADTYISPGDDGRKEIMRHLSSAHIILLLVSANFLGSKYYNNTEIMYAMKRYNRGEARVIPIILRPCLWEDALYGELRALPTDAIPVSRWRNQDEAFADVARGIRQVVKELTSPASQKNDKDFSILSETSPLPMHRSSRLRRFLTRRTLIIGTASIVVGGSAAAFAIKALIPSASGTIYQTFSGHTDAIRALAWSPGGNFVATASDDHTARVWNALTGKQVLTYGGHTAPVEGISWSPDGKRIVSGSADGTAQIWDANTGQYIRIYEGHIDVYQRPDPLQSHPWVNRVQWSSNGAYIVSCDQTSDAQMIATAQVWEAATGNTRTIYREHKNGIYSVAWSPDNTYIASVGYDGVLRVWEAYSGETLLSHSNSLTSLRWLFGVAWSPDGKYIAYGGSDHKVWVVSATDAHDASFYAFPYTGSLPYTVDDSDLGVRDIAWSPRGTYIAASSNKYGIHIFKALTKEVVYRNIPHLGDISALGWTSKGNLIASGNGGGASDFVVQIWQAPEE